MKQHSPVMRLSNIIKDSRLNDKNEIKLEKGGTVGPSAGSSGASGGKDETDSNSNLNSDEKGTRRLTDIDLHNFEQEPVTRGSNISSQMKSITREFERRRPSLPSNSPQEQQPGTLRHQKSETLLSQMNQNRKLELVSLSTLANNLELLEQLGNYLDKQYKYGNRKKFWQHLAQDFGVEAKIYAAFTRRLTISPTEDLFEFLKTRDPEKFTVGKLKDKLRSINREDVRRVILKFDDEMQVGSLFDNDPQVIGNMAFLLDKEQKSGIGNWQQLADMFKVPRSESQIFGESVNENPMKDLLTYLSITKPRLSIGEVKRHLKDLKMEDALQVLAEGKKVDNSPLKDLLEDLELAARFCNLLNKKRTSKEHCWKLLGNKLGVDNDTLDQFQNSGEGEIKSPTVVLIDYLDKARPDLTVADLIKALESIGRGDAVSAIQAYFSDGEISRFLESKKAEVGDSQQQIRPGYYETEV